MNISETFIGAVIVVYLTVTIVLLVAALRVWQPPNGKD